MPGNSPFSPYIGYHNVSGRSTFETHIHIVCMLVLGVFGTTALFMSVALFGAAPQFWRTSPNPIVLPSSVRTCHEGPYVWVRGVHIEGIGASIRYYRRAILLGNALGAKFIFHIRNHHACSVCDVQAQLGLEVTTSCTSEFLVEELMKNSSHLTFRYATDLFPLEDFGEENLCAAYQHNLRDVYFKKLDLNETTVIVVEQEDLGHTAFSGMESCVESCAYTDTWRERFAAIRRKERNRIRPPDQTWIGVHFRWGDVGDVLGHNISGGNVDWRTGSSFENFISASLWARSAFVAHSPSRSETKVFIVSEGPQEEFETFREELSRADIELVLSSNQSG